MQEQTKGIVGGCKQFECKVIGFPRPSVRWYKDGVNITNNKRYRFDYTREGYVTLIIENVTYKDQGAYQCQADNSEGRASTSASLLVRGHSSALEEEISEIHTMTFERSEAEPRLGKETSTSKKRPLIIDEEALFNKGQINAHLSAISGIQDIMQRLHGETNIEEHNENNLSFSDEFGTANTAGKGSPFACCTKLQNLSPNNHASEIAGKRDTMGLSVNDNNLTNDISFASYESNTYKASDNAMTSNFTDQTIHRYMKLKGNIHLNTDMDRNSPISTSEVTDDSFDAGVVENVTDSSEENKENDANLDFDEELHYLNELAVGLKGHDKSRRWTTDSGILSRESSLSSEPDMGSISYDAMLEMQDYLKGKTDTIYKNFGKERNLENESDARTLGSFLQNYQNMTINVNSLNLQRSDSFVNEITSDAFEEEVVENNKENELQRQTKPFLSTTANSDPIDREERKENFYSDNSQADDTFRDNAKSFFDKTEEKIFPRIQNKSIDNIYQKPCESASHVHESEHINPRKKNLAFLSDNETHTVDVEIIREHEIKPEIGSQTESRTKNVSLLNENSGYTKAAQPINNNIGTSGTYNSASARYATGETEKYVGVSYSIIPDYLNVFPKSVQQKVTPESRLQDKDRADTDKSFAFSVENDNKASVKKGKDVDGFVFNKVILLSEPESTQEAIFNRPEARADEFETMSKRIEHRSLRILDWNYLEDKESIINAGKYLLDDNPMIDLTPAIIIREKFQKHLDDFANSANLESRDLESEIIPIHRENLQEIQVERELSDGVDKLAAFEGDLSISRMNKFNLNESELSESHRAGEDFSAPQTSRVISHEVVSQTVCEINKFQDKVGNAVTEETWTEETDDNKCRSKRGVKEIIREKTTVSKTSEVTEKITVTKEYEKTTIETNDDSDEEAGQYSVSTIGEENIPESEFSEKLQTMGKVNIKQAQTKEEKSEVSLTNTSGLEEVPETSEESIKEKSAVQLNTEVTEDATLSVRGQAGEANQECLTITGTIDLVNPSEQDTKLKTGEETKIAKEVHTRIEESKVEVITTGKPVVAISKFMKAELAQASLGMTQSVVEETVITSEQQSKQETISEFIVETTREAPLPSSERGEFQNAISDVQETNVEEVEEFDEGLESATGIDNNEVLAFGSKNESSQEVALSVKASFSPKQGESVSGKETTINNTFTEMTEYAQMEAADVKVTTSIADNFKESGVTSRNEATFESLAGNDFKTTEKGRLVGIEMSISDEYDIVELKNLRNKLELEKDVDVEPIKIEISSDQNAEENENGLTEKVFSRNESIQNIKASIVSAPDSFYPDIKESYIADELSPKADKQIDKGISVNVAIEKSVGSDNDEPDSLSVTIDVESSPSNKNGLLGQHSISENSQSDLTQDHIPIEIAEEVVKPETAKKNITVQMCKQICVTPDEAKVIQGLDEKEIDQQKCADTDIGIKKGTSSKTKWDTDTDKITVTEIELNTNNESWEKWTTLIKEEGLAVSRYATDSQEEVRDVEVMETVTADSIETNSSMKEQQCVENTQFQGRIDEYKAKEHLTHISSSEGQLNKHKDTEKEIMNKGTMEKQNIMTDVDNIEQNALVDRKVGPGSEKLNIDVEAEFAAEKAGLYIQLHDENELKRPLHEKDSHSVQNSRLRDDVSEEVVEDVVTAIKNDNSESGARKTLCALETLEILSREIKVDLKMRATQPEVSKGECCHDTSVQETATKYRNEGLTVNAEVNTKMNANEDEGLQNSDETIRNNVQPIFIQAELLNEPSFGIITPADKTNVETNSILKDNEISRSPITETSEMGQKKEKLSGKTLEESSKNNDKVESLKPVRSEVKEDSPDKAKAQMDAEVRNEIKPRIWTDGLDVRRSIEETLLLKWKVEGFPSPTAEFYKDGILLLQDERIIFKCTDTDVILEICDLIPSDSGDYAVKAHNSKGEDVSLVTVHVTSSAVPTDEAISQSYTVPAFVVKPTLEISDDNGVYIKCAVEGDPLPEVVWYREGEALDREEYWGKFVKEGFHHLEVKNPALLDESQFSCQLKSDAGFAVHVFTFRLQGDKIVCSEVSSEEIRNIITPKFDLEITESQEKNLMLYKITSSHFDPINTVTLDEGEIIHVLGTHLDKQWLVQAKSSLGKICYAPASLICPADGSRKTNASELIQDSGLSHDAQELEDEWNVALASEEQTKSTSKQELGDNKKEQAGANKTDIMPERRKIQKPNIKSAPQGDREVDSPEFHRVLEPKDDIEHQKDKLSDDRSVAPEYSDGTTRPMFKKRLKKVACNLGDTTELVCVVSGNPAPKVLWLKNNRPLKDTDGCRVVVDGAMNMLIFPSITEDDLGLYTARAMNVNGSVMSSEELTLRDGREAPNVAAPLESPTDLDFNTPSYFFQMSSCHVEEGRLARFDCRVVAYPRPDIVWMRDGKVVESGERYKLLNFNNEIYSLLIQNVEVEDTGRYTCWARNKFGEAMTEAYLNVIAMKTDKEEGDLAANFLTRFYDQKVTEGVPAEFKCIIEGRPMPSVTWVMNDMEIREGPGIKMRHQDGMVSLEFKSTKQEHAGEYTCHISNQLGQAKCSATLTVLEDKLKGPILPKFLKRFDHISAREGDEAKFECIVVGEPSPKITWLFDHKPIPESSKRFVISREGDIHTLTVKGVRFEDDGKITCKASNNEGEVYCSANMYVRESKASRETPESMTLGRSPVGARPDTVDGKHGYVPTFTKRLNDYAAPVGTRAKFECNVMGIPNPDISWMKDGRVISPGGRYVIKRDDGVCALIIDNINAGDAGVFTCIASNAAGKSSSLAQLKVGDEKERTLERSHSEDSYTPSKRPLIDLSKPDGVPTIPYDKPTLLDVRGDAAKLSWLPAKASNLPTEARRVSYIVESRELPGFEWTKVSTGVPGNTYLARNLMPDKEYEFRVRAQNQYGVSEPTKVTSLPKRDEDVKKLFVDLPELRAPPKLPVSRPIITEMGDETIRLAWKPVESRHPRPHPSVSYRLEAKTLPGTEWTPITSRTQDTSYYFSELMPDRDYLFRVRAENEFGVSEPTESLWLPRARRFTGVPIERPQIVELEPHRAKLRWQRVSIPVFDHNDEPLLYMLEMEEPPRDWRTIAYDLDDTEYIIDGLKPGHDYRFRVRAKSPAGVLSEPSPIASLYTTLAQTRAPIDRLEVERYEPDTKSMQLSWQRVDIPPFDIEDEPMMYMLEYKVPHISDWRTLVSGIPTTRYRVTELMPDQDYQFRVRALSPYGISQPSPVLPVSYRQLSTAPIRPLYTGQLEITDFEPDGLRLSWRPPVLDTSQQIRYKVERQEPPRLDWIPLITGLKDTSYRVVGLQPSKDYKFRVIPEVGDHHYEPTPPVSLSTIPVRPRMPMQEPKLREHGPDSVQLSWPPAEIPLYQRQRMPLYYSLEMMELPSTKWVPVGQRIPDTTYTITGLQADRDYKFRVRAVTDFVASEPSLPVTLYRRPVPILPHHEPLVKDISANAILLTWQPALFPGGGIAAPVSYDIEIQTPPGVSTWTTILAKHPSCSARLNDLRPDLDYLVRVRAKFNDIFTEPTLPVYIPRRAVPPRLPCDEPYPVEIAPNAVKLQWRSAELPVHINDYSPVTYRVEVQEQPDKSWVTVARGIPHTDFKITNLNPEKDYMFRIRGENDYGLSEPTRPVHIRKRAADKPVFAPRLPSDAPLIFDVGSGSAKLSWRPADIPSYFSDLTPIYYTIYIQEPPSKSWRPLVRKIPHTMYHVTGLLPDRDYDFRIQAENEFGASQPTESAHLPRKSGYKAPVYIPEIDDFDEDYTAVKLRWKPQSVTPYSRSSMRYQVESWEPLARTWQPLATGIKEPSYTIRGLKSGVDNLYRIRAEADKLGPSEPSVPISVSRDQYRIPVYRPQLHEVEPDSVKLSWQPSRLPSMSYSRPVRYNIEMREIPNQVWRPIATDLLDTSYRATNLRPKSEYEFRIRALTDNGPSEPSLPVPLYRRPVIPTVRLEAPEIFDVDDDAMTLRWDRVDVPAFSRDEEPITFMIETQRLPDYEWQPMVRGLTSTQHRLTGLKPYQDYIFRVRGEYPSGYTAPSPPVPVYRRPICPTVPITHPEIWEEEPDTAHLRWHRAYIPKYLGQQHLRYRIEMQEPLRNATTNGTTNEWRPIAEDLTNTDFVVKDISPKKDYLFRIRAKTSNGELSEPTPPIPFYRSQLPLTREPFAVGEYRSHEYDYTVPNRPYFEHLTRYVPPRMPVEKPELVQINEETAHLNWKPAHVPQTVRDSCNLTYTIEVRTPPSFEWHELVSGLKSHTYTLTNLHPRLDYMFRVRGWNQYGSSEPGLPVSLYRPIRLDDLEGENEEEEVWEKEWLFGQQDVPISEVPPKLPMDTPRVTNFMPDSFLMSWLPARIPAYAKKTQITYFIEVKEPPSTGWRRFASGLHDIQYLVDGLSPKQDYEFRVRAETEFGISDPTLAVMIQRSKRDSLSSSMEKSMRDDNLSLMSTSLDDLTAGVPPRMPSSKPLATNIKDGSLTLTWGPARTPSYVKRSPVMYLIEMREPSSTTWTTLVKGCKENSYTMRNLNSDTDYMFRIKACNEFGMSEPTLPFSLFRNKDDYESPHMPRSRSGSRDNLSGTFWSKRRSSSVDYSRQSCEDLSSYGEISMAPSFITPDKSTHFFVIGKPAKITLQLRGYPLTIVDWFHGDEKLVGDMYKSESSPGNTITLEIKSTTHDTIGDYKCFVKNDLGLDVRVFQLRLADPPTILEPPKDLAIKNRGSGTLECRVDGIPKPQVRWLKDWLPLSESARVKLLHESPDGWSITITNAIAKDSGIYTCVAENEAGKKDYSVRITVEEGTSSYEGVNMKCSLIEEYYYILEEIGRGRHGIVRRVINKITGQEYAAKFIYVHNEAQKDFFKNEFECQKIVMHKYGLHLHDAYETERRLVLVSDLLQGDELLDWIIANDQWTENEAAAIVKQVLEALQDLHIQNVLHLDIKPSNIMMTKKTSAEIKLIDFGLSRWQSLDIPVYLNYGTPECTSPEQVNNEPVSPASDAWSVGVLTYILLCGVSPFGQISDKDTLLKVKECQWKFEDLENISPDARDFISKLLVKGPRERMSIQDCLNHPWISGDKGQGSKLPLTKLMSFQACDKLKRELGAMRTTAKLKSLCKILNDQSPSMNPVTDDLTGEIIFPDSEEYGNYLNEESWDDWHSRYQDDPDMETFPLHDPEFVARIQSYHDIQEGDGKMEGLKKNGKIRGQILKERQLDTDVEMENSLEGECMSISEQGRKLLRQSISQDRMTEYPLMFISKLHDFAYKPGDDITLTCQVISSSLVTVTWYRDEQLLAESSRIKMTYSENGIAALTILNAKPYDAAVYKCVARNQDGRISCLSRLILGDVPIAPCRPIVSHISCKQVFLIWEGATTNSDSYIQGYKVDYKKIGEGMWTKGADTIEEYALITGLVPGSQYLFRVSSFNKFGYSPYSIASREVTTKDGGEESFSMAADMLYLMSLRPATKLCLSSGEEPLLNFTQDAILHQGNPNEAYETETCFPRGGYGEYRIVTSKNTKTKFMMKIVPYTSGKHDVDLKEFNLLRPLSHDNIARVLESYLTTDKSYIIFERLTGLNVVEYLSLQSRYSEDIVSKVMLQVFNALQYLQLRKLIHLNLQPSSVVMATGDDYHVKLTDFTLARRLDAPEGEVVPINGYPDFIAPEIITQGKINGAADLWSAGVLTFLLLSGDSPFSGATKKETLINIVYNRYYSSDLYDNVSQSALGFIFKLLKRVPRNRLTVDECIESHWFKPNEKMVKIRQKALFSTNKLRTFCQVYDDNRLKIDITKDISSDLPDILTKPVASSSRQTAPDSLNQNIETANEIKSESETKANQVQTSLPEAKEEKTETDSKPEIKSELKLKPEATSQVKPENETEQKIKG